MGKKDQKEEFNKFCEIITNQKEQLPQGNKSMFYTILDANNHLKQYKKEVI